jgi:hypothetical protein
MLRMMMTRSVTVQVDYKRVMAAVQNGTGLERTKQLASKHAAIALQHLE